MRDAKRWARVQSLFDDALAVPPDGREEWLVARCGGDAALHAEVRGLLDAAEGASAYFGDLAARLGLPGPDPEAGTDGGGDAPAPRAGEMVGRTLGQYEVLEWLGEGGMASVYLAERRGHGFTQRVALKLLAHRGASSSLDRRAEAEWRILARLEHRNIARLIDAGTTPEGQPFYAMEYVDGIDVLRHCDEARMRIVDRLALFLEVCAPVQFAHERLVIHCDLKPSNIFVTADGHVKLLDFGVARLADPDAAGEATGGLWFTPSYASPEQVRREPPGTHSDVYSLGVLLYELLSGQRPYRFADRSYAELRRVVCEVEPPAPSLAARPAGPSDAAGDPSATDAAWARATTPERLARRLRGDLDAIVMKALRKEAEARYHTVEQLMEDVRRHLQHRRVHAVEGGLRYGARKFVRRHRPAVLAAGVVLAALSAGALGTTWQARRATVAAEAARAEAEKAQLVATLIADMFRLSDPNETLGDTITARQILDRGAERILRELGDQPVVQAELLAEIASVYDNLGLFRRAEPLLERVLDIRRVEFGAHSLPVSETLAHLGAVRGRQGRLSDAIELLDRAIAMREPLVTFPDSVLTVAKGTLAWHVRSQRDYERAALLFSEALEAERAFGEHRPEVAHLLLGLAATFHDAGRFDEADSLFTAVLADLDPEARPTPAVVSALLNTGMIRRLREQYRESERLLSTAVDMSRALYGPVHATTLSVENEWGLALFGRGRWDEAAGVLTSAIERSSGALGDRHPTTARLQEGLATVRVAQGAYAEGAELHRLALDEKVSRHEGADHPGIVSSLNWLAEALVEAGELAEARATLDRAREMNERLGPGPSPYAILRHQSLGRIAHLEGDLVASEGHYAQAGALAVELLRPDHRWVLALEKHHATLLAASGRPEEARSRLERVLATELERLGEPHPLVERTRALLAAIPPSDSPREPGVSR